MVPRQQKQKQPKAPNPVKEQKRAAKQESKMEKHDSKLAKKSARKEKKRSKIKGGKHFDIGHSSV
jgi:hypothetical protein